MPGVCRFSERESGRMKLGEENEGFGLAQHIHSQFRLCGPGCDVAGQTEACSAME